MLVRGLPTLLSLQTDGSVCAQVLCYWLNSWDWASQGENRGPGEPAQRFCRRCQIHLDRDRQLRCLHTPPLEGVGLQLDASLLNVEALLLRTIRSASIDVLASVSAELRKGDLTGLVCDLIADDCLQPRLELRMRGELEGLPAVSLVVDQRSGALRVVPSVGTAACAYEIPGALEVNAELKKGRLLEPLRMLWRRATCEYISSLAALFGLEPLGPTAASALRGPDGQMLDITLRVATHILVGIVVGDAASTLTSSSFFIFAGDDPPTQLESIDKRLGWRSALSSLTASASHYRPMIEKQLDFAAVTLIVGSDA